MSLLRIAVAFALWSLIASAPAGATDSAARAVDPAAIRELIEREWATIAPEPATLEVLRVPALRHRGGPATLAVVLPSDPMRPGPRALAVSCLVDGRTVARGLANILIEVEVAVHTVVRDQVRGELLDADALVVERIRYDREPAGLFRPEDGRRWKLIRDVPAGARLRRSDVRPIPDVEAGTEIILVSRAGKASVAVAGKLRRSGDVGDTVLVHNPVTGALVEAVLVDRNTAILIVPGSSVRENGRRKS